MNQEITKINTLLIANRGEIAVRIIQSAKKMGITCVAVYSDIDAQAMHVKLADISVCLGEASAKESYLNIEKIIAAALNNNCDAIHPGYGFLSENADFAAACEKNNIIFVGPNISALKLMGSKAESKDYVKKQGHPTIPGEEDLEQNLQAFTKVANEIGYPLLVKASAGGGGKGMKLVRKAEELPAAFESAKREALASFGNDLLLIERYFDKARHIEVQVLADHHGKALYLFDRDCSLQRRHQKVLEEAPAQNLSDKLKEKMKQSSLQLCKDIKYVGAGTIEFLVDDQENFFFMEMNTRLQVEHAVTEKICGIDLVEQQLLIAENRALSIEQDDIKVTGHSIEARLYAEKPASNFMPATGKIEQLLLPEESNHIRLDSAMQQNDVISAYYDPMIAKLVSFADSRSGAISKLDKALGDLSLIGVETNRDFLIACLRHSDFITNQTSTKFIEQQIEELGQLKLDKTTLHQLLLIACSVDLYMQKQETQHAANQKEQTHSPWFQANNWRVNQNYQQNKTLVFQGENHTVSYDQTLEKNLTNALAFNDGPSVFEYLINGNSLKFLAKASCKDNINKITISSSLGNHDFEILPPSLGDKKKVQRIKDLVGKAPLNGRVIAIKVKNGDQVSAGNEVVIIEAMKMEHTVKAASDGTIEGLSLSVENLVEADQKLFSIKPK